MFNVLFGISITLNILFIVGIFIYFKIKNKFQENVLDKFFCTDDELDKMLEKL